MATKSTTKPAAKSKPVTKPAVKSEPKQKEATLEDLNHNPSLLDTLSNGKILALSKKADDPDIPLAGTIRNDLNSRATSILDAKAE